MKSYLKIGARVQLFIIGLRITLRKTQGVFHYYWKDPGFWLGIIIGAIVNILVWPATIVFEIYNTIKGI